jgi:secreted trypsin-like serine protease
MGFVRIFLVAGLLVGLTVPRASAIIISGTDPNAAQWSASGLTGLAFFGGYNDSCSGALFEPSLDYILTAAHCVQGLQTAITAGTAYVQFGVGGSTFTSLVSGFTVNPGFSMSNIQVDDIAVVQLATPAPAGTQYYPIYTGSSPVGDQFTLAGYGDAGTGSQGDLGSSVPADSYTSKTPRMGNNTYDFASNSTAAAAAGFTTSGTDLFYDFDSGSSTNNAFAYFGLVSGSNKGDTNEASIGPGDSGGPSLINVGGQLEIAGIHSFAGCFETGASAPNCATPPAVSATFNYGFGDFAADTDVSLFTGFIDGAIGATAAPEPGTFGALALGLTGLGVWARRRKQNIREL